MTPRLEKNLSKPPGNFGAIIETLNKLPFDVLEFDKEQAALFRDLDLSLDKYFNASGNRPNLENIVIDDDLKSIQTTFYKRIQELMPPKFAKGLSLNMEDIGFRKARSLIKKVIDEKLFLYEIIREFNNWVRLFQKNKGIKFHFREPIKTYEFNQNSTMEVSKFDVLRCIIKYDIEVQRIRICPICQDIFWAKRSDSPTCSGKCGDIVRSRRSKNRKKKEIVLTEFKKAAKDGREKLNKQLYYFGPENQLVDKQIKLLNELIGRAVTEL